MSVSLYDLSVPALVRGLKALSAVLEKAAAYSEAKKFEPKVLLESRLFPNMFALSKQVQVTCDMAKGTAARLAEIEPPKHEDTETTIADLQTRIAKTVAFIEGIKPAQFQGAETRAVVLTFPGATMNFTGLSYLTEFGLPNFYFHAAMVYGLLRHNGLELVKRDFLAPPQ